ncbi:VWA domain-containing protein [Ralstonia pseudosolanacearum]|uniref:VWA domain-containing protein n=1 Tax=Ralstonia pseudosolanacearum TaxID=1310165 RepID=UPI003CF55EDA
MQQQQKNVSMRHLYLYTHLLLAEANRQGKAVRLEWADISTAAIGPDPRNPNGLCLLLPRTAAVGTEQDAILLRAVISHEILCHGHHTDFSVVPAKGVAGDLANVLEDPRGELLAAKRYPGSKMVIREGIEVLVDRQIFRGPDPDKETPASILVSWLVTELRSELLGQNCLEQFSIDFRKLAIEQFGTKLTGKVKAVALEGATASDTQGADQAARRIVQLLKLAKEEQENQAGQSQGNGQSQQGNQGSDNDQNQQGNGAGSQSGSDGKASGQSDNSGASDQAGGHQANGQGDQQQGANAASGGFEPAPGNLINAIDDVLSAKAADLGNYGKGLEQVLCEGNEAMQAAKGGLGASHTSEMGEAIAPKSGSEQNRALLRAAAKATAAALSLKMEELLEAFATATRRNSSSGNLRASRVWRVPLGDTQVFRNKTRHEELDTCMFLLVDESSSMDRKFDLEHSPHLHPTEIDPTNPDKTFEVKRKDAAGRVAVAAAEVLDGAEVPFGLASYYTSVREWKNFDEDWSSTLLRYQPGAIGSTNTHLAVVWALRKLIGRPEARKVLSVVTDGDPGEASVLEAALMEASQYGVEVRFILIDKEHESYYQGLSAAYGVAKNTRELAKAVFGSLEVAIS